MKHRISFILVAQDALQRWTNAIMIILEMGELKMQRAQGQAMN